MENNDYLAHLQGIKGLIEERVKFRALSGLSGVIAGFIALAGAYVGHYLTRSSDHLIYQDVRMHLWSRELLQLLAVAFAVLLSAIGTAIFFSARYARRNNTKLWTKAAFKALVSFSVPMMTGGIFIFALIWRGYYMLIAPSCLIFYGLALFNAAHYTFSDIRALGIALLLTGGVTLFIPGYGLLMWAFGFGILHIVYGTIMYFKYER
jgi:hypothetical protein